MKIAVIGAGISGIGAAWLLAKKHDVHLFESDNRLGGHANTVNIDENGKRIPVDTGFLVYNELTYPNLCGFFDHLGVETVASDMSLSVQVTEKNLEWSGTDMNGVFGQRRNLFRLSFLRMLREILRFHREADENLANSRRHAWSLGELMKQRGYSTEFRQDYMLPIGAAIWSTPEGKMMDFPAETFLQFFINHRLLQVNDRPIWRTVKNGSINYVEKAAAGIPRITRGVAVQNVERRDGKVFVSAGGTQLEFDRVVMATHAPVTARILRFDNEREERVLRSFAYEPNHAILHADASVMPKHERCWSSWNVYGTLSSERQRQVSLSYYLNRLQPLETAKKYFVTLNPLREIAHGIQKFEYEHPQFNQKAIDAQREIASLQGQGGVYFAGAWTRYGFHEDGLLSGVNVARLLGVETPWGQKESGQATG